MSRSRVAIVSRDAAVRMAAARAFDRAPVAWSVRLCEAPPRSADVVVLGSDAPEGMPGLRFDPAHPERILDEVAGALRSSGVAAGVAGACGGAGATTLALHLGAALGACVVDLSPDAAAAGRLGISEPRRFGEGDDARAASLPVAPGFRLLIAPGAPEAVQAAQDEFDRVVVDCAGAPPPPGLRAHVVVFPPALSAARRARELLGDIDTPCAPVTNRLGPGGSATRSALERALGRHITLALPCAPALRDADDAGTLLTAPHARWWRRVVRLAGGLHGI